MQRAAAEMTADVIYRAATDGSSRLRYIAGKDAKQFLALRRLIPDKLFAQMVRSIAVNPGK